ncbi:hypothetical protein [Parasitella parasitica]|uniref:HTH APSES-type domain-containing protein n=1 Tax=Parasitella parasitica TaxID=35722 RepID=A0A0B7N3W4_9FUNG|nr:hypothetical protein [Parasitella parasitica]
MNYSRLQSEKGVLEQKDKCNLKSSTEAREDQKHHQNVNSEQQSHWKLQYPSHETKETAPPASESSYMQQHSVLQMELPPPTTKPLATMQPVQLIRWMQRPKFSTSFWEEEGTLCYQVDANNICVARRQDNDMINGTKLLNVAGLSRGKRDGILKNENARVVVKVGPMHLKGVWITFNRAKELAHQFKLTEILDPLLLDDPSAYFPNIQEHSTSPVQSEILDNINCSESPALQINTVNQNTLSTTQYHSYLPTSNTATIASTPIYDLRFPYYNSQSSRLPGSVTHHVYPSYDDSSRNKRTNSANQVPVNQFLAQEDYITSSLNSSMSVVPPATPDSVAPTIHMRENTDFQAAARRSQKLSAQEMLLSTSFFQQQQQHRQEYPCPPYSQLQLIPNCPNSYEYLCSPPISANNSASPTPVDPSTTFQFELHSLHGQRNMNHHTPSSSTGSSFVSNPYCQQQQSRQNEEPDLYSF